MDPEKFDTILVYLEAPSSTFSFQFVICHNKQICSESKNPNQGKRRLQEGQGELTSMQEKFFKIFICMQIAVW